MIVGVPSSRAEWEVAHLCCQCTPRSWKLPFSFSTTPSPSQGQVGDNIHHRPTDPLCCHLASRSNPSPFPQFLLLHPACLDDYTFHINVLFFLKSQFPSNAVDRHSQAPLIHGPHFSIIPSTPIRSQDRSPCCQFLTHQPPHPTDHKTLCGTSSHGPQLPAYAKELVHFAVPTSHLHSTTTLHLRNMET